MLAAEDRERPASPTDPTDSAGGLSDDARKFGQLLLAAGKGVRPAAVARTCGLDLARVSAAVGSLQRWAHEPDSLLRITTNNSRVALLARDDAISIAEVQQLDREVMAVDELKHPAARLLSQVVHREISSDREQHMRQGDRPHLQSLLRQGLVRRQNGGHLRLSGDVAFSLGLLDPLTAKLRRKQC